MAVIHQTTVTPSKRDLVATWLPSRQWYRGTTPHIRKAGGFRLDDPAGEVGIEFLLFVDDSGADEVLYQVPLTYRGAPLPGGDAALVGTAEHGVLGRRWIYDGTRDRRRRGSTDRSDEGSGSERQRRAGSDRRRDAARTPVDRG
ncbi:maltokinase N-terminal cap-like domain-containing protein [Nocardia salmonicida]|uniref:maltokinase N-terminal cap-like domain-containing protein n=1 Tax=Nocardia salmonicida TaxID=53431 RepID=UPI00340E0C45